MMFAPCFNLSPWPLGWPLQSAGGLLAACASLAPLAGQACELLPLSSPTARAVLADPQPTLRWAASASGSHRVQVLIIQPEGRTLAALDFLTTASQVRLPNPVPTARASVRVVVSANCPQLGMETLVGTPPTFYIERPEFCRLSAASISQDSAQLRWPAVAGADRYRVQWQSAQPLGTEAATADGLTALAATAPPPAQRTETTSPGIDLGTLASAAQRAGAVSSARPAGAGLPATLVTVQPVCAGELGMPASVVLQQRP